MIIFNPQGVSILNTDVDDKSYRYKVIMGDNTLTLYFNMPVYQEIPLYAYCDFKTERYFLINPQNFKQNHSRNFEYTLILDSYQLLMKKTKFKFFTMNNGVIDSPFELKFSLTVTPAQFAQLLADNMNISDPDGGWEVGNCIESDPVCIDFNHDYCISVMSKVADAFSTEWEITNKTISFQKVEKLKDSPIPLKYGYNCGLIPGTSRSNAKENVINRLFIEGSDRNIDRSIYGASTLRMPKNHTIVYEGITYKTDATGTYIERDGFTGRVVEDSLDVTKIYPKRVGTVSAVNVVNAETFLYDIVDSSIPGTLDYSQLIIAGETMTIIFQTGQLAGKEFEVKYIHADKRFELVPLTENGLNFPDGSLVPEVNDKYAVFHCMFPTTLPNDYTSQAELDVLNEAVKYLWENEQPKYNYTGTMDELYAKRNWLTIGGFLNCGYFVALSDDQFLTTPVTIRITAVKEFINKPKQPEITLSNEVSGMSLGNALNQIPTQEQATDRKNTETIRFARRQFADVKQTTEMLQNSLLNFSGAISPISVKAMQYIAGDESLQFEFVANSASIVGIPHTETYDPVTKKFTSAAGVLQHKTIGITSLSSSHAAAEYKWWSMTAYLSPVLDETSKSYYLYAKVSKTANTGIFLLSETAVALESVAGYYHLLLGILNSENDGDRSYSQMYGYSELTPGRLTTKKIVSPSGNMFIDLENEVIQGNVKFQSPGGGYKEVGAGIAEAVDAVQIGCVNLLRNTSNFKDASFWNVDGNNYSINAANALYLSGENCAYIYQDVVVTEGRYVISGKINTFRQATSAIGYECRNAAGSIIASQSLSLQDVGILYNTIGNFEKKITLPANTVTIRVVFYITSDDGLSIYKLQLERGDKTTAYNSSPEDVEADATAKAAAAQSAAQTYALAKAELAETTAKAYSDGIVSDEEARAIADATSKANAAQAAAISAAAADATAKAAAAVDNLQIGGRNLLLNSGNFTNTSNWDSDVTLSIIGEQWLYLTSPTIAYMHQTVLNLKGGNPYVLSSVLGTYRPANSYVRIEEYDIANTRLNVISVTLDSFGALYNVRKKISKFITLYQNTARIELYVYSANGDGISFTNLKFEEGNKPTDWTPAPEDIQSQIDANKAILADITDDNKLTPTEKKQLKPIYDSIVAEYEKLYNQASSVGAGEWDGFLDAGYSVDSYLAPFLADLETTSAINGATVRNLLSSYYSQRAVVVDAINTAINNSALTAQAKADATDYLTEAMKSTTDVNGGLITPVMLRVKDADGTINGGMSGITSDNIGFWTGGTYEQALAGLAKAIIKKNGDVYFNSAYLKGIIEATAGKIGNLLIQGGDIIGLDSNSVERVRLTTGAIPAVGSITSPNWQTASGNQSAGDTIEGLITDNDGYLITSRESVFAAASLPFTLSEASDVKLLTPSGVTIIYPSSGSTLIASDIYEFWITNGTTTYNASTKDATITAVPVGTWTAYLRRTVVFDGGAGKNITYTAELGVSFAGVQVFILPRRTMIGSDGFYSLFGLTNFFHYCAATGLAVKGTTDLPGVLATGSVSSTGGQSNRWGAKISTSNASKGGTGIYNVPHTAGSSYTVQVTVKADNLIARVTSVGSNTFQVTIRNMSGTATDAAFDYTIYGAN